MYEKDINDKLELEMKNLDPIENKSLRSAVNTPSADVKTSCSAVGTTSSDVNTL